MTWVEKRTRELTDRMRGDRLRPAVLPARRPFPHVLALSALFAGVAALSFWLSMTW